MSQPNSAQTSSSSRPVVLVTGAAGGGIGTNIAIRFAEAGYDVIATDIKPLDSVKEDVEKLGAVCLALHLDVTDSESVEKGMYFSIKG
jgi:NAD(P)-dependent dehydrogenase (short-subunit alcohol dehydrogenase family)